MTGTRTVVRLARAGRGQTPPGRKIKAGNLRESRLTDAEILRRIRAGARNQAGGW